MGEEQRGRNRVNKGEKKQLPSSSFGFVFCSLCSAVFLSALRNVEGIEVDVHVRKHTCEHFGTQNIGLFVHRTPGKENIIPY